MPAIRYRLRSLSTPYITAGVVESAIELRDSPLLIKPVYTVTWRA
jgi:hypothetical protein